MDACRLDCARETQCSGESTFSIREAPRAGSSPGSTRPRRAVLACSCCNSNYKREQFPWDAAGAPLLIDPTAQDPREHLRLSVRTGKYVAKTPKGEKSIDVFGSEGTSWRRGARMRGLASKRMCWSTGMRADERTGDTHSPSSARFAATLSPASSSGPWPSRKRQSQRASPTRTASLC